LLVAPTGGGKSLVRDVCGVCFRGITLTIIPLLSLGTDQSFKGFTKPSQDDGVITALHLDEMSSRGLTDLASYLSSLRPKTAKTLFLFSSPQLTRCAPNASISFTELPFAVCCHRRTPFICPFCSFFQNELCRSETDFVRPSPCAGFHCRAGPIVINVTFLINASASLRNSTNHAAAVSKWMLIASVWSRWSCRKNFLNPFFGRKNKKNTDTDKAVDPVHEEVVDVEHGMLGSTSTAASGSEGEHSGSSKKKKDSKAYSQPSKAATYDDESDEEEPLNSKSESKAEKLRKKRDLIEHWNDERKAGSSRSLEDVLSSDDELMDDDDERKERRKRREVDDRLGLCRISRKTYVN
jgi:hypothetical protein